MSPKFTPLKPIHITIVKVEKTKHSGYYYSYFVGEDIRENPVRNYVPEKTLLEEIKDFTHKGIPVFVKHVPEKEVKNDHDHKR